MRPLYSLYIFTVDFGLSLFIQHGFSAVINARSIGSDCYINQQVTIGSSWAADSPTLGNGVRLTAGAKVLGDVTLNGTVKVLSQIDQASRVPVLILALRPLLRFVHLLQLRHVQVPPLPPLVLGDVLEPGGHEHEGRVPVREGADHPRASPDLAVYPLDAVVGPDSAPVLRWEIGVGQGPPEAVAHGPRRGGEPHPLELAGDFHRLAGACPARLPCADRL